MKLKMEDDHISGRIEVTSPEAHHMLVKHAHELNNRLQDLNIPVNKFEFNLMDAGTEQHAEGQKEQFARGQQHGKMSNGNRFSDVPENSQNLQKRLMLEHSTFEYIA